jgi:hypothetical protein
MTYFVTELSVATEIEDEPICSKYETKARFGLAISSSGRPKPRQSHAFVQCDSQFMSNGTPGRR